MPRLLSGLVAVTGVVAACGATTSSAPVHQRGADRLLDLGGGVELVLDPTTTERFIRVTDRKGDHQLAFTERDAEGAWARLEIHRFPVDPDTARALRARPAGMKGRYLADGPARLVATAGTRALVTDAGLPHGTHHEDNPGGGHSTVEDLPRYQWTAAIVTPTAVLVVIYIADLTRPEDRDLDPDAALREGRARHGARADGLLARLR